ncbi:kinase-like domain-containing protein [Mycena galopus ATCC 62051]|nr:kinase-like domain-containing protein [Mycena galopus ATCC 62051]
MREEEYLELIKESLILLLVLLARDGSLTFLQNFGREVLCWGTLKHPNILPLLGVDDQMFKPSFTLISPWMENQSLVIFLEKHADFDRLQAAIDIAQGMRYLHELDPPIVHADIHGANVLVTGDRRFCLTDFGLSAVTQMTITSVRNPGAAAWTAPEVLRDIGILPLPERDVYAFGCTLFQIFTGHHPFQAPPFKGLAPFQMNQKVIDGERPARPVAGSPLPQISDATWDLIQACWEHQPTRRPSARQILRSLGIPPPPSYTILRRPGKITSGVHDAHLIGTQIQD